MLKIEKYHGAGNDFIIVHEKDLIEKGIPDYNELAVQICDRHFGIGIVTGKQIGRAHV